MFKDLYNSIESIIAYCLPEKMGVITPYEKRMFAKGGVREYRLANKETDTLLIEKVEKISRAAGYKQTPKLFIYKSPHQNAGSMYNGSILISTAAIENETEKEIEATLAHEITHKLHRRTKILNTLTLTSLSLLGAGYITHKTYKYLKLNKPDKPILHILSIAALFSFFGNLTDKILTIPERAMQRILEKDADRGAAILTGDADAVLSHLKDLKEKYGDEEYEKRSDNILTELRRTHPHYDERISYIEKVKKEIEEKGIKNLSPTKFF
ncbi:MAG: M48 family metalloprotease [Saprospiraceae bacterium]|nr:M48 family metalloprotease [Saprospiraceae bacterium]